MFNPMALPVAWTIVAVWVASWTPEIVASVSGLLPTWAAAISFLALSMFAVLLSASAS